MARARITRSSVGHAARLLVVAALSLAAMGGSAAAASWTAAVAEGQCASTSWVGPLAVHPLFSGSGCMSGVDPFAGSLTAINLGDDSRGSVQAVGSPGGVAVTPDGDYAFVAGYTGIARYDFADQTASVVTLPVGNTADTLGYVAISPTSDLAYVTDPASGLVWPLTGLETTRPTFGSPINLGSSTEPEGVAFSPDGATAYVADNGAARVTEIDAAKNTTASTISTGGSPYGVAVAPDGSKLFVTDSARDEVLSVALPSGTIGSSIGVGTDPEGIAIAPDGGSAYVADYDSGSGTQVTQITNLSGTPSAGQTISLGNGDTGPEALAIAPDGKTLYVSDDFTGDVTKVDLQGFSQTPISVGGAPGGIAITPDQAPSAAFLVTAGAPGSASLFDASASSSPVGTIASYTWNFGDGSAPQTTSTPTTSHVYSAGTYTATLTVTNSAGTSTGQVFTGQTASLHGGPSATVAHSVVVTSAAAPAFAASPGGLTFPATQTGTVSAAQTVTVTNQGDASLQLAQATIGGADTADFRLAADSCSNQSLAPTATCSVQVEFAPQAGGGRQATLDFSDNATGSPQLVALSGMGLAPNVSAPFSLLFGTVFIGDDSAQTATIVDTGSAPLSISSSTITGADAADFKLQQDDCTGQTVLAGASCSVKVAFSPTALGPRTAQLSFITDAGPSPTIISLEGTGEIASTLSGTVTRAGGAPLPGAFVTACSSPGDRTCSRGETDASGRYTITGLRQGLYSAEAFPPEGPSTVKLAPGSAEVSIGAGRTVQDFALSAPVPLSGGISFVTPWGQQSSGFPLVNWDEPFAVQVPLEIPTTGPAKETRLTVITDQLSSTDGGFEVGALVIWLVHYDQSGNPDDVQGYQGQEVPPNDPLATASIARRAMRTPGAHAAAGGGSSGSGSGFFTGPAFGVESGNIFTEPGGGYTIGQSGPISPGFDSYYNKKTGAAAIKICGLGIRFQPVEPKQYKPPINGDPYETVSTAVNNAFNDSLAGAFNGPGENLSQPVGVLHGDTGQLVNMVVRFGFPSLNRAVHGQMENLEKFAETGFEQAKNASGIDPGKLVEKLLSPEKCEHTQTSVYVDPSGTVHTRAGHPIAGARVVLRRAASRTARLKVVAHGSAVMSLANRRNPDRTNIFGQFGWDVLPGFYRVSASRKGCRSAQSALLSVPPPVSDLSLTLACPRLRYARTTISLRVDGERSAAGVHTLILVALVAGRHRGEPLGVVTFVSGAHKLGQAVVDPRSGTATLLVTVRGRSLLRADYSGDGVFAPSRSTAHRVG